GVSPRGPPRTVREPLDSYSSYGGNRTTLLLPQRKQVRLAVDDPKQPGPRTRAMMKQGLVFATRPANQRLADMPLDGPEHRRIETTVVVKPSAKLRVYFLGEFSNGFCCTKMQFPTTDLITDLPCRVVRDGWTEAAEQSSSTSSRLPGPKRKSQEVELLMRVTFLPIRVLAVDEPRLLRVQLQATLA